MFQRVGIIKTMHISVKYLLNLLLVLVHLMRVWFKLFFVN
jgi:hypothetical protein